MKKEPTSFKLWNRNCVFSEFVFLISFHTALILSSFFTRSCLSSSTTSLFAANQFQISVNLSVFVNFEGMLFSNNRNWNILEQKAQGIRIQNEIIWKCPNSMNFHSCTLLIDFDRYLEWKQKDKLDFKIHHFLNFLLFWTLTF